MNANTLVNELVNEFGSDNVRIFAHARNAKRLNRILARRGFVERSVVPDGFVFRVTDPSGCWKFGCPEIKVFTK